MRAKVSVNCVSQDGAIVAVVEKAEGAHRQGNGLSTAWVRGETMPLHGTLVGPYMLPYEVSEHCCLSLRSQTAGHRFVSVRLGPLLPNDTICKANSIKLVGEWHECELEWVIEDLPLKRMAKQSPTGLVAWRCKIWSQARVSRWWLGRSLLMSVPTQPQSILVGGLEVVVALQRGTVVDDAMSRGAKVLNAGILKEQQDGTTPQGPGIEELFGRQVLSATGERHWGVAVALLRELSLAPRAQQQQAMTKTDHTKRTSLRLCVDGQWEESPSPLQVMEGGTLTVILGVRRPYFWLLKVTAVCGRSLSFLGDIRIGMPRSRMVVSPGRPWTARPGNASLPSANDCQWSDPQACAGRLEVMSGPSSQFARMHLEDYNLMMLFAEPGEVVTLGPASFHNPLAVAMLVVQGSICGAPATGIFDMPTCARLAAELAACKPGRGVGPREAAAAALACGALPHAVADDGLSPYTAALLTEDPCELLSGLDPGIRARIRRSDASAWAEVCRSSAGAGRVDLVATPLTRGLDVPEELAQGLLAYCFQADLPLLALRVLGRFNGEQNLLQALERAEDPQWLKVVDRILQQSRNGSARNTQAALSSSTPKPPSGLLGDNGASWFSTETLSYALHQSRLGRRQFRLLLHAFLDRIRSTEEDFFSCPAVLIGGGAECSICFEPLCLNVPVAFVDSGRAVCPHFLCSACARRCASSAAGGDVLLRCPECRRQGSSVSPMPQLAEDPVAWFDFLAAPGGTLHRTTLIRAVSAMLPVDADQLATALDQGFVSRRPLGEEVTAAEFLANGLYAWVRRHEEEHRQCLARPRQPPMSDRTDWFKYWDVSRRGFLTRGDLLRAILRKFEVSSLENHRVDELRRRVSRVWDRYIADRKRRFGHCSTQGVTSSEFLEPGGMGELLEDEFDLAISHEDTCNSDSSTPWLSDISHYPQIRAKRVRRAVAVGVASPVPGMARMPARSLAPRRRSFASGRAVVVPEDQSDEFGILATPRTRAMILAVVPDEAPESPSDHSPRASDAGDEQNQPTWTPEGDQSGTLFDLVLGRRLLNMDQQTPEAQEPLPETQDERTPTEVSSENWIFPGRGTEEPGWENVADVPGVTVPQQTPSAEMFSGRAVQERRTSDDEVHDHESFTMSI